MRVFRISLLFSLLFSAASILVGCATPKATSNVEEGANLNAYNKVFIAPLQYQDGASDRYGIRADVRQKLTQLGFDILSEAEAKRLGRDEAARYLYCAIEHNHTPNMAGSYATVRIEMYDMNNDVIYSGSGRYQSVSIASDLSGAARKALEGFVNRYSGFDPSVEPMAVTSLEEEADKFSDWETIEKSKEDLQEYLDENIDTLNPIEGIWTDDDNNYRVGIFRQEGASSRDFVAYILRTDHPLWRPGQVKMEFDRTAYNRSYNASYYVGNHSRQGTTAVIDESGLLQIEIERPDGSPLNMTFIKNYPFNVADGGSGNSETQDESAASAGSGFVLDESGLVATNYHVIAERDDIDVFLPGHAEPFDANVLVKDESNDIAILKLESFSYEDVYDGEIPFSLAGSGSVQVGQEVFTIGYPLGSILGESANLSDGIIGSTYGIDDDPRLYQISTPVQPGNSGGPLFNRDGELVGIVVGSLSARYFYERADIIPQNVNFAVKANYLSNVISMLPESDAIMSRDSDLIGRDLEAQAAALTPFVVNVKAQ